jgi:5-methylcytosine-specific restriction endonuclease McrA
MKRITVLKRDDYTCRYCGEPTNQVDHIIPKSFVKDDSLENLVAACGLCNRVAKDRVFDSFEEKCHFILVNRDKALRRRGRNRVRT